MRSPRTFTDTYLRSLKPRAASYDVTDPGRRGLQVRVFPTGQKSFQLRYRLDGVTRRMTIGPYPAWSLAEAHFAHTEATKLLAKQIDPAAAKLSARDESVPILERSVSRAIRNNEAHFEVPHFTPHDLRRTAATMLSRLGTPRLVVTKVLNHTDDTITAVYDQHDYVDEKRLALHSWAEHLLDVVGGKSTAVVPISCSLRLRAR